MAAVFAGQGWGQFFAALVVFICAEYYKDSLQNSKCDSDCQDALDVSWRILYGVGIVPAVAALFLRFTLPETIRYTLDVDNDETAADMDSRGYTRGEWRFLRKTRGSTSITLDFDLPKPSIPGFFSYFYHNPEMIKVLLGTAGSWFLLDVAFVSSLLKTSSNKSTESS